jgi:hypothetical protein
MPRTFGLPFLALLAALGAGPACATRPGWDELRGLPVVEVRVLAQKVFDPGIPEESGRLYVWANSVHTRTRDSVIRREVLLNPGEPFEPLLAEESERNLRAFGIFQEVLLTAEAVPGGVLLQVRTTDRWALHVRTELSRRGGINQLRLGVESTNLLGLGIQAGGSYLSSTDVSGVDASYHDPRFFDSRWDVAYAFHRDALTRWQGGQVDHPFYSETARWSAEASASVQRGERDVHPEPSGSALRLDVDQRISEGFAALHHRDGAVSRWALVASRRRVRGSDTPSSDIAAVGLAWSLLRRDYWRMQNLDLLGAGEDVATGWTFQLGAGADARALGADRDRPFWRTDAAFAHFLGGHSTLVGASLRQHSFVEAGRAKNARVNAATYGFWQKPGRSTLAWQLGYEALYAEPTFLRFTLGGDDLLRGYPARTLSSTRVLYVNVEDRLFTNWRLGFLRLGALLFVDVAQAWDDGTGARRINGSLLDDTGLRLGGGVGLRLGYNRSGSGVSSLELSFGKRSVQVSFASGSFFRVARGLTFLKPSLFR